VSFMDHDWDVPQWIFGRHTCKRCGVILVDSERLIPCGAVDTSYYIKDKKTTSTEPRCVEKES
jgi:hypothetical protein